MSVINDYLETIRTRILAVDDFEQAVIPTRQGKDPLGEGDLCQDHVQIRDKLVTIQAMDVEPLPEFDRPGNPPAVGQYLPVMVNIVTIPNEKSDLEAFVKQASANGSAAQNAITSPTAWHTFGGNSIDAEILPVKWIRPEGEEFGSVFFTVGIKYRVNETNFEILRA
jgi:hypothetical protein